MILEKAQTPAPLSLSRAWRVIFACEILICLGTVLFWVIGPAEFLRDLYGIEGPGAYLLLQQSSNVVFCAYVYLYFRLLTAKPFDLRAFRWLQEAMAIGDVLILATSVSQALMLQPKIEMLAAQAGMAALWLTIRLLFLWQSRK
jgi:hypothetical protein